MLRADGNYDMDAASLEVVVECLDKSLTQQQFKDDADINTIVKRFGLTGQLPSNLVAPVNADFSDVFDFHSAMMVVRRAQESFDRMPADVRFRFGNDPGAFVDFCSNRENLPEMKKLGLVLDIPEEPAIIAPKPEDGPKA